MTNQKPMSCKIDNWAYESLKEEAHISGHKANRIINNAIVLYVQWVDMCRRIKCGSAPNLEINEFYQNNRYTYM